MRKTFLENLPKHKKGRGGVSWADSIGMTFKFIYDDIEGEVEIISYKKGSQRVYLKYKDNIDFLSLKAIRECSFAKLLKIETPLKEFKYKIGARIKDDTRDLTVLDQKREKSKDGCTQKFYLLKCNLCGYTHWKRETGLYDLKSGCPACCPTPRIVVKGINDIATTDP